MATTLIASPALAGFPSTTQIRKKLMSPGVKKIVFTKKTGTKQWNASLGAYEYVRGVEGIREYKEIDGVDLVVVGDVVYQQNGKKWSYWKFRVAGNHYLGLPNPTLEEIRRVIDADQRRFFSSYWYDRIVSSKPEVRMAADPKWKWHDPTGVEFRMVAVFDAITSNTEVQRLEQQIAVRLYRDSYKAPWNALLASSKEQKVLWTKKHEPEEIKAMVTLGALEERRKAQAAVAKLPHINVPRFENPAQLVMFTHKVLLDGDPLLFESYMMKVLAPFFFNNKAAGQLNQRGADLINQNARRAYKGDATYKLEYCRDPGFDARRSTKTRITLLACIQGVNTLIAVGQFGGKMVDGVRQGQEWMITDLHVGVNKSPKAVEFIKSFSDRRKLCPNDK